jgi:hypothetical protein
MGLFVALLLANVGRTQFSSHAERTFVQQERINCVDAKMSSASLSFL